MRNSIIDEPSPRGDAGGVTVEEVIERARRLVVQYESARVIVRDKMDGDRFGYDGCPPAPARRRSSRRRRAAE